MISVDISTNLNAVRARIVSLSTDLQEKAAARALNRAGDQGITRASREIRRVYNISASRVRSQIKVVQRARLGNLAFVFRVSGKRIALAEFSPRQTKKGVTIQIKKGGARKLIPHAFLATMSSGHTGVFVRSYGSKGRVPGDVGYFRTGKGSRIRPHFDSDTPISEFYSLDVPKMVTEQTVVAAVKSEINDSFMRNFQQQVDFLSRPA